MATTNIELDIENITGVSDADNQFIISAQKFVVSSIPKELLSFAQKASSASTDGSAISFSVNDSITDVQRNGYSCLEIPMGDAIWALDSSSLRYATAKHPVFYHKQGGVHFAPVTDGSNAGYVFYIDYSLIDDDCDLRNAVIFHAAAKEFSQLATDGLPSWTSPSLPVPPASPDFGDDLTISVSAPVAPSIATVSYTDATNSNASAQAVSPITVATVSKADISGDVPTYTKPVKTAQTAFSAYTSGLSETDPGVFSLTAVKPATPADPSFTTPSISTVTISNVGTPPTYTAPVVGGDASELSSLSALDDDNTIDVLADQSEWDQWFSTAAHLIEDEEDTELASVQIQKINSYINAYSQAMQNQLNTFNDANAEYQAKLQESIQQAQINAQEAQNEANLLLQKENQEYAAKLQKYSSDLNKYQADVSKEVQEYQQKLSQYNLELNTSLQSWQKTESDNIQLYQTDIQNELNEFNKENARYQANIQAEIAKHNTDLQKAINQAQIDAQDAQQEARQTTEIDQFNKAQDQALDLANRAKQMEDDIANNNIKVQKYTAELNKYQQDIAKEVQDFTNTLGKESQEYQNKLGLYSADLQKFQSDVAERGQESTVKYQNTQYYEKASDKYYQWAQAEIAQYIQNNSKIINRRMAARENRQEQRRQYRR